MPGKMQRQDGSLVTAERKVGLSGRAASRQRWSGLRRTTQVSPERPAARPCRGRKLEQ